MFNVHSPFVYKLVFQIFYGNVPKELQTLINSRRKQFLNIDTKVRHIDYGAGSKSKGKVSDIEVKQIAETAVSGNRKCKWLYNIVTASNPTYIVELGTSLGISTIHLSWNGARVTTLEGNPDIAALAKESFQKTSFGNRIDIRAGRFDDLLPDLRKGSEIPGLVYIDGNHTYEATLRYFHFFNEWRNGEKMTLVFDDIYWSSGMKQAWKELTAHNDVGLSIDLFQFGIVFLTSEAFHPPHYCLVPNRWKPWHIGFKPV